MQGFIKHLITTHAGESFYVANMGLLNKKMNMWKEVLPSIRPFYAMKCNPDEYIMKNMINNGFGFDAASKREIDMAINIGANAANDIIYAHPVKAMKDINYAVNKGVSLSTFDSTSEVEKMSKRKLGGLLRLRVDNPSARIDLGIKYGVDRNEYKEIMNIAHDRGVDVRGVCFHVGSASGDPMIFKDALGFSRRVIEHGRKLGYDMDVLDIGGGFTSKGFIDCARVIRDELNNELNNEFKDVKTVIAEPGRYFVEDVFTFFTPIIGQKVKAGKNEYWISDSLYGSFNCILYDDQIPTFAAFDASERSTGTLFPSIIHGITCDSRDTLEKNIMLPKMKNGDYFEIKNFGAYTIAGACNFNGINMMNPRVFYYND